MSTPSNPHRTNGDGRPPIDMETMSRQQRHLEAPPADTAERALALCGALTNKGKGHCC
jgi:hypothetical protein